MFYICAYKHLSESGRGKYGTFIFVSVCNYLRLVNVNIDRLYLRLQEFASVRES